MSALGAAGRRLACLAASMAVASLAGPAAEAATEAEVVTLEEAAAWLRVSPEVLRTEAEASRVPGRRIGGEWRFSRSALLAWLGGDTAAASGPFEDPPPLPRGGPEAETPPPTIGEPPEAETTEEVFLRDQQVLLSPGDLVVEPSAFYTRSDPRTLNIVFGGDTTFVDLERNTARSGLAARYGLLQETELLAEIVHEREWSKGIVVGSTGTRSFDDVDDLKSLALGLRRTIVRERPGIPNLLLLLGGTIPIDNTSPGLTAGISAVSSFDPAILFGGLQYERTFARQFDDPGLLQHDHVLAAVLGYGFSLNEALTLSMALTGVFSSHTEFEGTELESDEEFSLRFGMTRMLRPGSYVEPVLSFLLNGSESRVTVGVNLPYLIEREDR